MQGNLDNDLQFSGRFNWRWTSAFVTKTAVQLTSQGNMVSLENDYTGADFSASLKAVNPSLLDGGITGMLMASYLQAVTPRLSLGIDAFWSRPAMAYPPELNVSYAARYRAADWMACGQIIPDRGVLEASYWRRLTDKVETGINCNLAFAGIGPGGPMAGPQKEGNVTIGAKYDFRQSSFRAQIDNQGKVSCLLEKMIAPPIRVTFSGEIDQKQVRLDLTFQIHAIANILSERRQARSCRRDRSSGRGSNGATRAVRRRHVSRRHPILSSLIASLTDHNLMTLLFAVLPQFLGSSERAPAFQYQSHDIRQPNWLDSISSRARLDDGKMAHCLATCNGATAAVDVDGV